MAGSTSIEATGVETLDVVFTASDLKEGMDVVFTAASDFDVVCLASIEATGVEGFDVVFNAALNFDVVGFVDFFVVASLFAVVLRVRFDVVRFLFDVVRFLFNVVRFRLGVVRFSFLEVVRRFFLVVLTTARFPATN